MSKDQLSTNQSCGGRYSKIVSSGLFSNCATTVCTNETKGFGDFSKSRLVKCVGMKQEQVKVSKAYIQEEWSEGHPDDGGDGYWIALKAGWCWAGDPIGAVHCIHEDTKSEAYREYVRPCTCVHCKLGVATVRPQP